MSSSTVRASTVEAGASPPKLEHVVQSVARLLPAQGPISIFIHHNPLHAFEHLPFEQAVLEGARLFGCEPFLAEQQYRDALGCGRIENSDLEAELVSDLGPRGAVPVVGELSRLELRRRILVHGLPEARGTALAWLLSETNASTELREDLPADARAALATSAARVHELWSACRSAAARSRFTAPDDPAAPLRHRDLLLAVFDIDVDAWVHPLLIRITGAYIDQGLADWQMPDRERGLYACFVELYRRRAARLCRPFGAELQRLVREEAESPRDAWSSLAGSLAALGVGASEWQAFLTAEALALRGFAGMVHQFEMRPDRVPAFAAPARLVDFLAVGMLIARAALQHAATPIAFQGELSALRPWLRDRLPVQLPPQLDERAWPLFHIAQLCGLDARAVDALAEATVTRLEEELAAFDATARRRIFHLAYERHLRHRFFDAFIQHRAQPAGSPAVQAIFCIDEREESMRRHLEEVDPDVETFGAAGFFGVAMYYRGATDARPRPLCPVAIRPRRHVVELGDPIARDLRGWWRRSRKRLGALVDKNVHLGSRRAGRGAVLMATLGVLWILPLVLRVVFPWLGGRKAGLHGTTESVARRRLVLQHPDIGASPSVGEQVGFTNDEMAEIVHAQLLPLGIRDRFARLVLVLGHGSTSLNNPHESAHDCGACGGGRGGPNARAFAQMANDPAVRAALVERGLRIPPETWFVGGQRNTANNDIELFDLDTAPPSVGPLLARARASLGEARRREAHERCRRFESAPLWLPSLASLLHVQARAADLAQPRPEYGHATNAVCVIGRRQRTRGLFLDRRAFLVSYDPDGDADGRLLAKLLASVVPVVAGISLEYLFGYIDRVGYGCGTKLPHNVTGLVGVMDGAQSDLRTGLPWQMLEIHEPVRVSVVVEAKASVLQRVLDGDAELRRLVDHRWIFLAAIDPDSGVLDELEARTTRRHEAARPLRRVRGPSQSYYHGHREHLPFVALDAANGDGP